jgi:hypothetical protein
MRFDTLLRKKFPMVEKPKQGDAVAVFMGRGSMGGLILTPSKRKSKVKFVNGNEEWIENKNLRIINDEKWMHEIISAVSKSSEEG